MRNLPAPRVSGPVLFALLTTLLLLAVSLIAAPQDGASDKNHNYQKISDQSTDLARFPAPPDDILYPKIWVKSGQERVIESYVVNPTGEEIEVAVSYSFDQGPAPWMTVSPETLTVEPLSRSLVTVTLNPGGAINPPAGTAVPLEGSFTYRLTTLPYPIAGMVLVNTIVADTVVPVTIDTITTGMGVSLTVASNGNAGNSAIPRVSMDFVNSGLECDEFVDHYLYDLTPVIMPDNNTLFCQPYYDIQAPHPEFNFAPVPGSPAQNISHPDYNAHKTEIFVTADSSIGLIKTWYAPTANVAFIIERVDVFSFDGVVHPDVRIGEWIDWDIPTEVGTDNLGGSVPFTGGIAFQWMQGIGSGTSGIDPGAGCQDNTLRYGLSGMIRWYRFSEYANLNGFSHTGLFGAQLVGNEIQPPYFESTFITDSAWALLNRRSYSGDITEPFDAAMWLSFGLFDISSDTLTFWLMHASTYDDETYDVSQIIRGAETWYLEHFSPPPYACCGLYRFLFTGNTNCDIAGTLNLVDVTRMIDRIYLSKKLLCCEANGDVNCDGRLNLTDITCLIGHIYHVGEGCDFCSCNGW